MKKIFLLVFLSILFLQNTGRCADMTSIPQRGIAALKNKDYEQAYAEGQRMVKLNPRRPEGYKLMVLAHMALHHWKKSIQIVTLAERQGIRDLLLYEQQAAAYLKLGEVQMNFFVLKKMEDLAKQKFESAVHG